MEGYGVVYRHHERQGKMKFKIKTYFMWERYMVLYWSIFDSVLFIGQKKKKRLCMHNNNTIADNNNFNLSSP